MLEENEHTHIAEELLCPILVMGKVQEVHKF